MITLSVTLSEACNLNCAYCDVDKKSRKKIDPVLFIEEYHKLRAANPDELIKIDFFGGEPLMQYDTVKYILDVLGNEDRIKFFMPTNGLLLDQEKIDYLQSHNVEISLSFDGLWQDKNRLQPNNKGTLHRYLAKADMFSTIKNFRIHCMIQRGNYNLLENHLFIMEKMGANPELTLVRDVGTWTTHSVERLKGGITEFFEWYVQNIDTAVLPAFIRFYLRHIILYKAKGYEVKTCGASEKYFSFSENNLIPCNRFKDQPQIIAVIPQFVEMNKCQTCEVKNYCEKGCLYEQIQNGGPIDELCVIYKHIYSEVFKMLGALKSNERFVSILKKEIANEF